MLINVPVLLLHVNGTSMHLCRSFGRQGTSTCCIIDVKTLFCLCDVTIYVMMGKYCVCKMKEIKRMIDVGFEFYLRR